MPNKILNSLRARLRARPEAYDWSIRVRRSMGVRTPIYCLLDDFSRVSGRSVRFIQLGASDGLHSDPVREFVVRDDWSGVFVEPLPFSFTQLRANYAYLRRSNLLFVNAAVSTTSGNPMTLWTFSDAFLARLSNEERIDRLQKSSFNFQHILGGLDREVDPSANIVPLSISTVTVDDLARRLDGRLVDLLVMDLEGYEGELIPGLDLHATRPNVLLFESHNLGSARAAVDAHLAGSGYYVRDVVGDSVAIDAGFLAMWRRTSTWAAQYFAESGPR